MSQLRYVRVDDITAWAMIDALKRANRLIGELIAENKQLKEGRRK